MVLQCSGFHTIRCHRLLVIHFQWEEGGYFGRAAKFRGGEASERSDLGAKRNYFGRGQTTIGQTESTAPRVGVVDIDDVDDGEESDFGSGGSEETIRNASLHEKWEDADRNSSPSSTTTAGRDGVRKFTPYQQKIRENIAKLQLQA